MLTITGPSGSAGCLGLRFYREDFPPNVDLVLTAAHCLTDVEGTPSVTVTTLARQTGRSVGGLFWPDLDLAFLLVMPRLGPLDPIRNAVTQLPIDSPVFAMVRGGSGAPAVASARVQDLPVGDRRPAG